MTVQSAQDEFKARAVLVAEAQQVADEYSRALRERAVRAFLIAAGGVLLMWLAWELATWPLPGFLQRSLVVEELREHGGR
jgi:hypothetical protein